MLEINKIWFSESSGFARTRAMELANLLEVAYSEYETWDNDQTHSPSDKILGSTEFVDLEMTLELPVEKPKLGYGRLDDFWKTKTVKQYDRIANFWATEWWWLRLLDIPFLSKALKGNLGGIFQDLNHREGLAGLVESAKQLSKGLLDNFKDLVVDDQLFGFIARSQTNPNEVFVVFRGTREAAEWLNNFRPVPKFFLEGSDFGRLGEVRNGFNRVYSERNKGEQPTIKETIERWFGENSELLNKDTQIFITGHSLGAALATLATVHIKKLAERQGIEPNIYLYTFASPRVGGAEFSQHFQSVYSYRIFNTEDLVPSIPLPTTQVVDDAIFKAMQPTQKARLIWFRGFLETITDAQSTKQYQHVGIPITFTNQTGTIAGNHNLTKTHREALRE